METTNNGVQKSDSSDIDTPNNNASIGESMPSAESGWTRYQYDCGKITYYGGTWFFDNTWSQTYHSPWQVSGTGFKFNFVGTKFRLIAAKWSTYSKDVTVKVDGVDVDTISLYSETNAPAPLLMYEKTGLDNKKHSVEFINNTNEYLIIQAIDIDETGELFPLVQENTLKVVEEVEETIQLSVKDDLGYNIQMTWTSSDSAIASVDNQGRVTGVKAGDAVITVTNADGTYTDTINILVIEGEEQLAVDLNVGGSQRLTVDDLADIANVTWTSDDSNIATVDTKGKVTAVAQGTTYITVKDDQENEIGKIYVRVRN